MCLIQFLTSMLKSCYTTERERRRVPENVFSAVIVKVPSCALLTLMESMQAESQISCVTHLETY